MSVVTITPKIRRCPNYPSNRSSPTRCPVWRSPARLAWSSDDRLITYLYSPDHGLTRQLYAFDPASGEQRLLLAPADGGATEENISLEEQLRRERLRQRELGVTQYDWARRANRILVPLRGDIYMQDGLDAPLRKIVDSNGVPALNPQLSPDGASVAYVQDSELYIVSADGGEPRQLTSGARGTGITHGLAEYVAQEEMARRAGFWWSHDSAWLAFEQADETHIPIYRIMHQGKDATGEHAQEDHRYPFAGAPNARVRLGVVSAQVASRSWMDLGADQDIYLARVQWLPDGSLSAQIENRAQTTLDLLRFDPRTGKRSALLQETSDIWINLHQIFRPLRSGDYAGSFIWASERDGFQHLYLYDRDGGLIRQLHVASGWSIRSPVWTRRAAWSISPPPAKARLKRICMRLRFEWQRAAQDHRCARQACSSAGSRLHAFCGYPRFARPAADRHAARARRWRAAHNDLRCARPAHRRAGAGAARAGYARQAATA